MSAVLVPNFFDTYRIPAASSGLASASGACGLADGDGLLAALTAASSPPGSSRSATTPPTIAAPTATPATVASTAWFRGVMIPPACVVVPRVDDDYEPAGDDTVR
jgi:hypothetical protein